MLLYIRNKYIYITKKNYRRGEEHGSAKWGIAGVVNKNTNKSHFVTIKF